MNSSEKGKVEKQWGCIFLLLTVCSESFHAFFGLEMRAGQMSMLQLFDNGDDCCL